VPSKGKEKRAGKGICLDLASDQHKLALGQECARHLDPIANSSRVAGIGSILYTHGKMYSAYKLKPNLTFAGQCECGIRSIQPQ